MLPVDHLVYATPDLLATVEEVAAQVGVSPVEGGRHPGWGTRNYLLSLGPRVYLEIVGPDEDQPVPEGGRIFRVDEIQEPRLVRWAAAVSGLSSRERAPKELELGPVLMGERERPDGVRLRWSLTDPRVSLLGGTIPFLIDWMDTPHPAGSTPGGGSLVGLEARHPDPEAVRAALAALGHPGTTQLPVQAAPTPGLKATLETPRGTVVLT